MKIMTKLENIHNPKIMAPISFHIDLLGRVLSPKSSSLAYSSLILSGRDLTSGDLLFFGSRGSCS